MSISASIPTSCKQANQIFNRMVPFIFELDKNRLCIFIESQNDLKGLSRIIPTVDKIFKTCVKRLKPIFDKNNKCDIVGRYSPKDGLKITNTYSELLYTLNDFVTCFVFAYIHFKYPSSSFARFCEKKASFVGEISGSELTDYLKKIEDELSRLFNSGEEIKFYWKIRACRVLREKEIHEKDSEKVTSELIKESAIKILSRKDKIALEQVTPQFLDSLVAAFFILKKLKYENLNEDFMERCNLSNFELCNAEERRKKCAKFCKFIQSNRQNQVQSYDFSKIKKVLQEVFVIDEIEPIWIARAHRVLKAAKAENISKEDVIRSSHKVLEKLKDKSKEDITIKFLHTLSAAVLFLDRLDEELPEDIQGRLNDLPFDIKIFDRLADEREMKEHLNHFKEVYFN